MSLKVDAKGLKCPEPIMLLHKAIRESRHGDTIEVFATDPSTERDIDKLLNYMLSYDMHVWRIHIYHL